MPRALSCSFVAAVASVFVAVVAPSAGCSSPDPAARIDPVGPDQKQFDVVAPVLSRRCGSIDCHGSNYRNFRIYGYGGTRLRDPAAPNAILRPDFPAFVTPVEIEASYEAVIGLEPALMRDLVAAGGASPERLTLVRKARGEESHKGAARIRVGDDADQCLTTWLKSAVDVGACERAGCVTDGGIIEGLGCTE